MDQTDQILELMRRVNELDRRVENARVEVSDVFSWTPTLWQAGAQIAITITYATYQVNNGMVTLQARIVPTAASGSTGQIEVRGLPRTCKNFVSCESFMMDAAGGNHVGTVVLQAGVASLGFWKDGQSNWLGTTPAFAIATTNAVRFSATYEAA